MQDYLEKPKKKKKREKEEPISKAKPTRNFKIIDDDININDLQPSEENEILVDLLDAEGPIIVEDVIALEKPKEKEGLFVKNKWVKLDFSDNDDSNGSQEKVDREKSKSLFKKRGDKSTKSQNQNDSDSDMDTIPRKNRSKEDADLSPVRRRSKNDVLKEGANGDLSPVRRHKKTNYHDDSDDLDLSSRRIKKEKDSDVSPPRKKSSHHSEDDSDLDVHRKKTSSSKSNHKDSSPRRKDHSPVAYKKEIKKEQELVDETKVRVKRVTKEEELKKAKAQELKAKYAEWGKGLVQKKQEEEKLQDFLHEADKPLARHADDKDLDRLLKNQEREDDPMLEYLRNKRTNDEDDNSITKSEKKPAPKYRGPPPPPNRYNILPGSKWDGVDRSNGFEKKYFESITARKAFEHEAYKWSTEDM